ncbi:hypothetical protein [Alishewanella sp. HH-ZS]|uniref:hypothetical protein n=1 Tax=Alishewanella sp. HH-ZS TaxID=1856684 RepID=UPI0008235E59|nr:hypothetical protein [Alishewanella sp. HH-ZS]OCW97379.1 hypothetical protein A9165_06680 [Alishewanella sp. HH-ZS]
MTNQTDATLSFFDYGDHTIKVMCSMSSGKEQVYVDEQLVSEKRSFRYHSTHQFELDGKKAEIRVKVASIFKGPYYIEFSVDGKTIDSDEWDLARMLAHLKQLRQQQPLWQRLGVYFMFGLLGGACGALIGYSLAIWFKG